MPTKLQTLLIQEQVLKTIRQFFTDREFHEVVPAVLNQTVPLEPTIYPFQTEWQTQVGTRMTYLSTSPEKNLKAALAVGLNPCFAIGKAFRNLDQAGSQHQPEFLMLEWYRKNATSSEIMIDTQALFLAVKHTLDRWQKRPETDTFTYQNQTVNLTQWQTVSLETLFKEKLKVNLVDVITDKAMQKLARCLGYDVTNATWEQLFNQCFLNELEPTLSAQPTFVTDFPVRISPLCTAQPVKPYLADRFEVYIAGMELGNGNAENTDVTQLKQTFQTEAEARKKLQLPAQPIDQTFLDGVAQLNDQTYAGIGVGIERLIMLLTNVTEIQTVTPFPLMLK